jgi:hypothetical protein
MLRSFLPFLTFAAICCLSACYQPQTGCLDPNATNFDVNADRDTGACVYPLLRLKIAHLHDTTGLSFDSIYTNDLAQQYRIRDVAYYMSGFAFPQGLQTYTLIDTFHAHQPISTTSLDSTPITPTSDIGLIRRNVINLNIGSFKDVGVFDGIKAEFGLRNELVRILPGSVRVGFPLRTQPEMLYDSTQRQYQFARIIFERLTNGATTSTDTVWLGKEQWPTGAPTIAATVPLTHEAGYDFEVKMAIDYAKWFAQTDLTQPILAIKGKIAIGIPDSFTFE